jgi:hypothetical protein
LARSGENVSKLERARERGARKREARKRESEYSYHNSKNSLTEASRLALGISPKPFGYWTSEKRNNIRLFLEKFARTKGLDPLVPENWYAMSGSTEIRQVSPFFSIKFFRNSIKLSNFEKNK